MLLEREVWWSCERYKGMWKDSCQYVEGLFYSHWGNVSSRNSYLFFLRKVCRLIGRCDGHGRM